MEERSGDKLFLKTRCITYRAKSVKSTARATTTARTADATVHGDRTTPVSAEELAQRSKFKVVRLAAIERSKDLMHLTYDQMDFIEERKAKGAAFKYTTYKGWLFGKAWKCYDESTNTVTMPERLKTIG